MAVSSGILNDSTKERLKYITIHNNQDVFINKTLIFDQCASVCAFKYFSYPSEPSAAACPVLAPLFTIRFLSASVCISL